MLMHVRIADRTAYLPMDRYEAEGFLYELKLDGPGTEQQMEMISNIYDIPVETGTDFRALNRLAQRICELGDQREGFIAWCRAQERCTVEDALKAACNIRLVEFHPGFCSDELLGEHALDNCIFEEYDSLSDETHAILDRAKVGARFREQEGGRFVEGGYLVVDGDFAGAELMPEEPLALFQVWFSNGGMDSGWLDVPLTEADERFVTRCFDVEGIEKLHMEYCSSLPQLCGFSVTADNYGELCGLNEVLSGMSGEEILKYQTLAEVLGPRKIEHARWLADHLDEHTVELAYADPAAYARDFLEQEYGMCKDDPTIQFIDLAALGKHEIQTAGYRLTAYGAVLMESAGQEMAPAEQAMRLVTG